MKLNYRSIGDHRVNIDSNDDMFDPTVNNHSQSQYGRVMAACVLFVGAVLTYKSTMTSHIGRSGMSDVSFVSFLEEDGNVDDYDFDQDILQSISDEDNEQDDVDHLFDANLSDEWCNGECGLEPTNMNRRLSTQGCSLSNFQNQVDQAQGTSLVTNHMSFPACASGIQFSGLVSANDRIGFKIDNLKEGDIIHIESISGIASFTKGGIPNTVSSIIAMAGALFIDGKSKRAGKLDGSTGAQVHDLIMNAIRELNKNINNKRRDGYGKDPGSKDYGRNEGGIIVCMPSAYGAIYAGGNHNLKNGKKTPREPTYWPDVVKRTNSFFPCRDCHPKQMTRRVTKKGNSGVATILAFDKDFGDNSGHYKFTIKITRPTKSLTDSKIMENLGSF